MVLLKLMPIAFGAFFLGPLIAELLTRTPAGELLSIDPTQAIIGLTLTQFCMLLGTVSGVVAAVTGRWI